MGKINVEYLFDPFEIAGIDRDKIPKRVQNAILSDVADYVLESTLSDVGGQKSPVTGRAFPKLSKDYLSQKKKEGGTGIANLELHGDMLDSLFVKKSGDQLRMSVSASQQAKADGHNNFSGESLIPQRKFIPNADEGETFRPEIRKGIRSIILGLLEDEGIDLDG